MGGDLDSNARVRLGQCIDNFPETGGYRYL